MPQNRNKLIELLISNLANAIIHKILEKSAKQELSEKYNKEMLNSFEIAKIYRAKINPLKYCLPSKDKEYIKKKVKRKVRAELVLRIEKGYENINLNLIDFYIEEYLKELNVSE